MKWISKHTPFQAACIVLLISWLMIRAGIALGTAYVPAGDGFNQKSGIQTDLFRFDAEYYYAIATEGYSYNGEPHSSPNIVFAPLYPALIWTASWIPGLDEVWAGFILNKLLLLAALTLLISYLRGLTTPLRAFGVALAMATSAGAYAFHAYYSESTMFFLMALALYALQKQNRPLLAAAAVGLGASRLTGLPMALAVSLCFLLGWKRTRKWQCLGFALLCPLGAAAYLGYIWSQFGNPFTLFPEIQKASWGFFHPEADYLYIFSGKNILDFVVAAAARGSATFTDIKTLNLIWTLLALASVIWSWRKFGAGLFNYMFTGYFLFIYVTGGNSDFLISAHRFYALMLPIFLMAASMPRPAAGLLFCLNLFYCLLHTAYFNQGIWFFF